MEGSAEQFERYHRSWGLTRGQFVWYLEAPDMEGDEQMEDQDYGDCKIVIESHIVDLKQGDSSNGGSIFLPCGERYGGVDSIRRINKKQVEVLTWREDKTAVLP